MNGCKYKNADISPIYRRGVHDGKYQIYTKINNKIKELEQIKSKALTFRTVEMMNDKIQILELILEERNDEE